MTILLGATFVVIIVNPREAHSLDSVVVSFSLQHCRLTVISSNEENMRYEERAQALEFR